MSDDSKKFLWTHSNEGHHKVNISLRCAPHPTGAHHDIDIKMLKYLETIENGFFIEAGANNGLWQSNTLLYETDYSWSGLLVEPNRYRHEECILNRPNSIVENYALVGPDHEEDTISGFFQFKGSSPDDYENSLCAQVYDFNKYLCDKRWVGQEPIDVPAITLEALLEKHSIKGSTVDFFSLDVEGYEMEVLDGLNLDINRPTYILIETGNNNHRALETLTYMKFYKYEWVEAVSENDELYKVK